MAPAEGGSLVRGLAHRMRAWMLTRTERRVDFPACHLDSGGPGQVPRRLRQTFWVFPLAFVGLLGCVFFFGTGLETYGVYLNM